MKTGAPEQGAVNVTRRFQFRFGAVAASWLLCALAGCGSGATKIADGPAGSHSGSQSGSLSGAQSGVQSGEAVQRRSLGTQLFASAVDMLSRTDEFEEGSTDAAVAQIVRRLNESLDVLQP